MKYLLTILLMAGIASATYPGEAFTLMEEQEVIMDNNEVDSDVWLDAKDTQLRCRWYLAHWHSDANLDGAIDLIDLSMLCEAWLANGRP